jgi:hypothetical protein
MKLSRRRSALLQFAYLSLAWLFFLVTLLSLARIFYLLELHQLGLFHGLALFALGAVFAGLGCLTVTALRARVVGATPYSQRLAAFLNETFTSLRRLPRSGSGPAPHLPPRDSRC